MARGERSCAALDRVAGVAVAVATLALAARRVWAVDYWWQLAAGRWILDHGWPRVDPFSGGRPGLPWLELRWVYEVALAGVVDRLGVEVAVALKAVCVLAAFCVVGRIGLARETAVWSAAAALLAVFASSQRFFLRPEVVSFLLLAVFLSVVHGERRRRTRWLLALPFLQVLWTNTHSLFALGPIVVGTAWLVALAERRWPALRGDRSEPRPSRFAGVLVACLVACLVNPYGLRGAAWPLRLLSELHGSAFKESITEFQGALAWAGSFREVRAFLLLAALTGIAVVAAGVLRRSVDLFWVVTSAAYLYLAWTAVRNVPLFCLAAVPTISLHLDAAIGRWLRHRRWRPVRALAALGLTCLCAGLVWSLATQRYYVGRGDTNQLGLGLARHRWPRAAADELVARGVESGLFNTVGFGGYLLARGLPVFVDPRLEVYGEAWFERAVRLADVPAAWTEDPVTRGLRWAIVPIESPLVRALRTGAGWGLVRFDEVGALLVRDDVEGVRTLDSRAELVRAFDAAAARLGRPRRWSEVPWSQPVDSPRPYERLALLAVALGERDQAVRFQRLAAAATPPRAARGIE